MKGLISLLIFFLLTDFTDGPQPISKPLLIVMEITEGEIRHFNPEADASYIQAIQSAFESTRKQEYQDLLDSGMDSEKAWDLAGERSRRDLLERLRDRWQPKPKPKEKTIPSPNIPKTSTTTAPLPPRLPTATITIPEFGSGGITSTGVPNDPPDPSQTGEDFEKRKPNDKKKTKTGYRQKSEKYLQ